MHKHILSAEKKGAQPCVMSLGGWMPLPGYGQAPSDVVPGVCSTLKSTLCLPCVCFLAASVFNTKLKPGIFLPEALNRGLK